MIYKRLEKFANEEIQEQELVYMSILKHFIDSNCEMLEELLKQHNLYDDNFCAENAFAIEKLFLSFNTKH